MQAVDFADIKVGRIIAMDDKYPCKITDVKLSKTGKHGHAKKVVMGTDIITGNKHQGLYNHHSHIKEPLVDREEVVVMDLSEMGFLSILDSKGQMREDIKLDEDKWDEFNELLEQGSILIKLLTVTMDNTILYKIEEYKLDDQ